MEYPLFSHETRRQNLENLKRGNPVVYDAVIVGGGIVGAGLARELAIRGVQSLLVEKGDFASGTSSRSSKLIHGGLRYLEMMDFHLVFEALSERHWLLKTHPHLIKPLEFDLPIYAKSQGPQGAKGGMLLGFGLWLYELLSLFRTPFFHGRHSIEEMKKMFPHLREKGLKWGYYYADAMMLDDEVVLETLLDAFRRGATPLNYVKAIDVIKRGVDGLYEIHLEDTLSLNQQVSPKITVKAREVIACVGPWTEQFGSHVVGGPAKKLKPSKGAHFIVPWKRLPIQECLVMYAPDGRIVFAIPRKDLGPNAEVVIVGTTDSPERGNLDEVYATRSDIHYLLQVLTDYFPTSGITDQDIIMSYAGVRPLMDTGEASEAKTSREHEIWKNNAGITFMAGGKYTTFRKISQELADFSFPATRSDNKKSKEALSDFQDYTERLKGEPLWGRFTDEWVRWKIEHHSPCNLEDIIFRRLPLWMAGSSIPLGLIDKIASIAQPYFGWTDEVLMKEKEKVNRAIQLGLRWKE